MKSGGGRQRLQLGAAFGVRLWKLWSEWAAVDAILTKPFEIGELREAIVRYARKSELGR